MLAQDAAVSNATALPIRVRYSVDKGIVIVEAHLGSGLPIRSGIDTGLPVCVVSKRLAAERGIAFDEPVLLRHPLGTLDAVRAGRLSVRIGGLMLERVPFVVSDIAARLSATHGPGMPELWLGLPAVAPCAVTIDPAASVITFARPDAPPPRGARIAPLDISSGRMEAPVRVNGGAARPWIVSTGLPGTIVPGDIIEGSGLSAANAREVQGPSGAAVRVGVVALKEITIGTAKLSDVNAVAVLSGDDKVAGVLGTDVLLRSQVYINCARRQIGFGGAGVGGREERSRAPERPGRQ